MATARTKSALKVLFLTSLLSLILPAVSWASDLATAQFSVASFLVRIWLAMVSGMGIIAGVMIALDNYDPKPTLEPVLTDDSKVKLVKEYKISYRKIGGGLLCIILCSALFATSVFLLPDKRTGRSGIAKIVAHFKGEQYIAPVIQDSVHTLPAEH